VNNGILIYYIIICTYFTGHSLNNNNINCITYIIHISYSMKIPAVTACKV